jgi:hypothetical protein
VGSRKSLTNQVLDRLEKGGEISGKEPLSRLTDCLKAPHREVKLVVDGLATEGRIIVERSPLGQVRLIGPRAFT